MLAVQLGYALLFLSLCVQSLPLPLTPLNERRQEISWQAWLLVDDQNQYRQNGGEGTVPRRRITTKSVFVAPTLSSFSPESLPPCAEGYRSDPMGGCIKIVMLDENRHLEFLVNKYGPADYEDDMEEVDASDSEPLQVNIPIGEDYSNDNPQEESDIAIIITPTIREVNKQSNVDKREDGVDDDAYEKELKELLKTTTTEMYVTTTLQSDVESFDTSTIPDKMQEIKSETTTIEELSETTTILNSPEEEQDHSASTTTDSTEETSTSTDVPTTQSPITTTTEETTTPVTEVYKVTRTTPKITTYHPKATTYHPYFDMNFLSTSKTRNIIKFPDEHDQVFPRSHSQGSYVRFPDMDSGYQQESENHRTRDVTDHFGNFFNEIVTPEPSQKVRQMVLPSKQGGFVPSKKYPVAFPRSESAHRQYEYHWATTESHQNKRSRERQGDLFLLPQRWSEKSPKPLVLRFSRKHINIHPDKLKNHVFYRSLPMEDLSVLFGYKNEQTVHR